MTGIAEHSTYHHGNLREELLDKALHQLKQVGPDKVSLRALARSIGVSQTAPYRHFADKNALLAAIAADGYRALTEVTRKATADLTHPGDKIVRCGHAYISFARANPELYKLMFGPVIENPLEYEELAEAGNASFHVILDLVAEGLEQEVFAAGDASVIAHSCWALVHGMASLWIDGMYHCTGREHDESLIEESLQLSMQGILRRDAR